MQLHIAAMTVTATAELKKSSLGMFCTLRLVSGKSAGLAGCMAPVLLVKHVRVRTALQLARPPSPLYDRLKKEIGAVKSVFFPSFRDRASDISWE